MPLGFAHRLSTLFNPQAAHPLIGNFLGWPLAPPRPGERRVTLVLGATTKTGMIGLEAAWAAAAGLTGEEIYFLGGVEVLKNPEQACHDSLLKSLEANKTIRLPYPALGEEECFYADRIFKGEATINGVNIFDFKRYFDPHSTNTQQNMEQALRLGAFDRADSILIITHPSHMARAMATLARVLLKNKSLRPKDAPALLPLMACFGPLNITPEKATEDQLISQGLALETEKIRHPSSPLCADYAKKGFILPVVLREDPPPPKDVLVFSVPHAQRRAQSLVMGM